MKFLLYILSCFSCLGAGLLSMPGTLENITPSPIRGLVAFWNFDGNSLSNDVSSSVIGSTMTVGTGTNHLTMNNFVGSSLGLIGLSSAHSNNSANYWKIAAASSISLCQEGSNYVTFCSWIKPDTNTIGNDLGIIGKIATTSSSASNGTWGIYNPAGSTVLRRINLAASSNGLSLKTLQTDQLIVSNQWNYVVSSISNGSANVWVNLTNYYTSSFGYSTNYKSTRNFGIGAHESFTSTSFPGKIDECGIWSGSRGGLSPTLTSNEIKFLWNNGNGRRFPFNSN